MGVGVQLHAPASLRLVRNPVTCVISAFRYGVNQICTLFCRDFMAVYVGKIPKERISPPGAYRMGSRVGSGASQDIPECRKTFFHHWDSKPETYRDDISH